MAKKNHYYILVFTGEGPVYVTGIPKRNTARWDCTKRPKEFSASTAEDITMGLNLNGSYAVTVKMPYELDFQPYRYSEGGFEWKFKEDNKD